MELSDQIPAPFPQRDGMLSDRRVRRHGGRARRGTGGNGHRLLHFHLARSAAGRIFPHRDSASWQRIAATGHFCANIPAADQAHHSQRFAAHGGNKFAGIDHGFSPLGQPLLDNALAWIECSILSITAIGDHLLVVGAVQWPTKRTGRPCFSFADATMIWPQASNPMPEHVKP